MSLNHRYDFLYLFDVKDGNPNGDPDAGNLPRIDAETGFGLVTDVCIKRKVRNFVGLIREEQPPYEIYVKEKAVLNNQHKRAYIGIGAGDLVGESSGTADEAIAAEDDGKGRKAKTKDKRIGGDKVNEARDWMCRNFFDVRTFGAVMSTGINCGQVRGPVQMTFARSVERIASLEHAITRMAVATEAEAEKQSGDNRTMGRKFTVPYGLYVAHGFVSAPLARQTGFSEDDLELLWQSLEHMFEHDRSAARGEMSARKLIVFKHDSLLGNAPAHQLFKRISVQRKNGNADAPARDFDDYDVLVDNEGLPSGVTLIERF